MSGPGLDWSERYEALRAHVTGMALSSPLPLGLTLLRRRGVAAWMAADTDFPDAAAKAPGSGGATATSRAARTELVRILAGMALLRCRRVGA